MASAAVAEDGAEAAIAMDEEVAAAVAAAVAVVLMTTQLIFWNRGDRNQCTFRQRTVR